MLGILIKPKYLLGHILIHLIALTCFLLSSWQFSRLDQRKALNSKISSRMEANQNSLSKLGNGYDKELNDIDFIKENEYRRVVIKGKYKKEGSVLILGRSYDGDPGYNIMTPFETEINNLQKIIYINVGFIPTTLGEAISFDDTPISEAFSKIGDGKEYSIEGLLMRNESKSLFGSDKQIKPNKTTNRIDINTFKKRIGRIEPYSLTSTFWVQLIKYQNSQSPERYPEALRLPELSEKNHFSYALQWTFFGFVAIITWIIICIKAAKSPRVKS